MSERGGIFAGDDPVSLVQTWMDAATPGEMSDPNAMALATVDEHGMPNVRIVLLKSIATDSFVFYTNYESEKGREIALNAKVAFVLHWKSIGRQVRVRGVTEREDGPEADKYFASRPLQSRLGAWASRQSRPLSSRAALVAEVARQGVRHGGRPGRPPHWGGIRVRPLEIEFWAEGEFRLHDRFRWARESLGEPWSVTRLSP